MHPLIHFSSKEQSNHSVFKSMQFILFHLYWLIVLITWFPQLYTHVSMSNFAPCAKNPAAVWDKSLCFKSFRALSPPDQLLLQLPRWKNKLWWLNICWSSSKWGTSDPNSFTLEAGITIKVWLNWHKCFYRLCQLNHTVLFIPLSFILQAHFHCTN